MASKRFVQHFSVSCAHELSEAINRWLAEHPDVDIVSLSSYKNYSRFAADAIIERRESE